MKQKHLVPLTRRQRAGSLFWKLVSFVVGWCLYVYWWAQVLGQEPPREIIILLLLVVLWSMVLLASALRWIWHNRRQASRGTRGSAAKYSVPKYEHDALGRRISLPQHHALRAASIVTVESTKDTKTFTAGVAAEC
jgi:hypothetical protein